MSYEFKYITTDLNEEITYKINKTDGILNLLYFFEEFLIASGYSESTVEEVIKEYLDDTLKYNITPNSE